MGLSVEFYKGGWILGCVLIPKGYANNSWEMWFSQELFVDNF